MLQHKGTQLLETPRLILRKFTMDDAQAMYENWASDPEVTKFLTWPTHGSVEVTENVLKSWVDGYAQDDFYQWAIVPKGLDAPIGSISVVSHNDKARIAHIGYCIGKRWWHRGITSEALQTVIDFLFDEVGVQRIETRHDPNNPHSGDVMKKCGMKYEGTLRRSDVNNQGLCDACWYSILDDERKVTDMDYREMFQVKDDAELVEKLYGIFDEDTRLNCSKAARVEFITNTRIIEQYIKPGARILDVGAGTGEYSLYFARKGYDVSALELAESNIRAFRKKLADDDHVDLVQGNALDLSRYEDSSFDAVLLFGPLYHLHDREDRRKCIEEAKRVCKADGKLFIAFISNDAVFLTELMDRPDYFINGDYNKETFRLDDVPFVFHTLDACRELLNDSDLTVLREVASDGVSELLAEKINAMDDESYAQYLRYHEYICEKPELLGMTNHFLFVCSK